MKTLRLPRVLEKVGMSRAWIYARIKEGTFPQSYALGVRARGWLEADIDAWLEARKPKAAA